MVRLATVLLAALVAASCSGVSADEHERALDQLRSAEQATNSLQQDLDEQEDVLEQLRSQVETLESGLVDATDRAQSLEEQLAASQEVVEELRSLLGSSGECGAYRGVVCQGYVTDSAGVLEGHQKLEAMVATIVDQHGYEIAVVLVPTTGGIGAETFSNDLGNTWGVGDSDRNDGLVVLVDLGARDTWITSGPGLNLGLQYEHIAETGNTFFVRGDWDGGVEAILAALEEELPPGA